MHHDYTTVGHVTVDLLADGSRRPGGAAFYSAVQAARLGLRTLILTQGVVAEIEALLEPHRHELDLQVIPAAQTTTFQTSGWGEERRQRVLAWAGPMEEPLSVRSAILHLAPVARETPERWSGEVGFLGLTPQGLVRCWSGTEGELSLGSPPPGALALVERCDALVLSARERASCAALLARARAAAATVAITAESDPTTILLADGGELAVEVPPIGRAVEDLGAGDVFAASFFAELAGGADPARAASLATAAAGIRMQARGASGIGDRARIEARLRGAELG